MDLGSLVYHLGIVDDMSDELKAVIKEIKDFEKSATTAADGVGDSFSDIEKTLASGTDDVADASKRNGNSMRKSLTDMADYMKSLNQNEADAVDCVKMLGDSLERLTAISQQQVQAEQDNGARLEMLYEQIDALKNLKTNTEDATESIVEQTESIEDEADGMQELSDKISDIAMAAAGMFTLDNLMDFGRDILEVRSNMTSLQKSFVSLIGDEDKANAMFQELSDFATQTPMQLDELAEGMQTMLGFGIDTEKIIPIMKEIGDVSMGDAQKFNSLVLAFAQMSSTGKLMGQDLNQMINAGFNPLNELSRETGKSIGQLKDEMAKGQITVEMVEKAFEGATSEGGQFYKMLESQSNTISGAMSNFDGAIVNLKNDLGETLEGPVTDMLNLGTKMIDHYKQIATALEVLIATVGTYKAALLVVKGIEQARKLQQMVSAYGSLAAALKKTAIAQKLLNSAALKNPYVIVAAAIAGATVALYKYVQAEREKEAYEKSIEGKLDKITKKYEESKDSVNEYVNAIKDENKSNSERLEAYNKLIDMMPRLASKYKDFKEVMNAGDGEIDKFLSNDVEQQKKESIASQGNNIMLELQKRRKEYQDVLDRYNELQTKSKNGTITSDESSELQNKIKWQLKNYPKYIKNLQDQLAKVNEKWQEFEAADKKVSEATAGNLTREKYEQQVSDWKETVNDSTESIKSRLAALEELKKVTDNTLVTEKEIKGYEKMLAQEQKERQRELEQNRKEDQRTMEAAKKQLIDSRNQRAAMIIENEQELSQLEIDQMKDGLTKELAQIELDYRKETDGIEDARAEQLEQLKKDKWTEYMTTPQGAQYAREHPDDANGDDWIAKNVKIDALPDDYETIYQSKETIAKKKRDDARKKAIDEALAEYRDYEVRRQKLAEDYDNRIFEAERAGFADAAKNLDLEKKKELFSMDFTELQKNGLYNDVFSNLEESSTIAINAVKKKIEDLQEAYKDSLTPGDLNELNDALKSLNQTLADKQPTATIKTMFKSLKDSEASEEKARKKLAKSIVQYGAESKEAEQATIEFNDAQSKTAKNRTAFHKAIQDATAQMNELGGAIQDVGTSLGGTSGEIIELAGQMVSFVSTSVDGIERISKKGADAIKTVEKASVILAIISAAIQVVNKISEAFGAESKTVEELTEKYEKYKQVLGEVVDAELEAMSVMGSEEATKQYDLIIENLEKEEDAVKSSIKTWESYRESKSWFKKLFEGESATNAEDAAAKITSEAVKQLQSAMEGVGTYDMFGIDKINSDSLKDVMDRITNMSYDEITAFKEKASLFWSQLPDELQEYLNEVIDLKKQMDDATNEYYSTVLDVDIESFRNDFKDLMNDMDADAADFCDNFEQMMRKALVNEIYKTEFKDELDALYKQMGAAWEDGSFEDQLENFRSQYKGLVSKWEGMSDDLDEVLGSTDALTSLSGALSSASQESIDLLAGQCNAIRVNQVESINILREQLIAINNIGSQVGVSNSLLSEISSKLDVTDNTRAFGIV